MTSHRFDHYPSVDQALAGIEAFQKYFTENGIKVKFVRAPTGLHSEITAYLRKRGVKTDPAKAMARTIIKGKPSLDWISNRYKGVKIDKSYVILCHDTTQSDVEEVKNDIELRSIKSKLTAWVEADGKKICIGHLERRVQCHAIDWERPVP